VIFSLSQESILDLFKMLHHDAAISHIQIKNSGVLRPLRVTVLSGLIDTTVGEDVSSLYQDAPRLPPPSSAGWFEVVTELDSA
jgi:hypothetical protein